LIYGSIILQLAPKNNGNQNVNTGNIAGIVRDIVNDNNDTTPNGSRSTAVQRAVLGVVFNGSIIEPAYRAKARLAVLIASAQELSDRLV
jgi:hypothetical protein